MKGKADMGGFVYDSSGSLTMDWPYPSHCRLDDLDEECGDKLEALEGGRIEDILVVWDALDGEDGSWVFDFPTILRLEGSDVVVRSGWQSMQTLGIAFERVDTGAPVTVFGCDAHGPHEEYDHLYELSWRSYEPLGHFRGLAVEQFYWRADSNTYPNALGCRLRGNLHLRIGGTFDATEPTQANPLAPDGDAAYDDIILPVKYRKPAKETPVITDVWKPESTPLRILTFDRSWMEHGCKRDARRRSVFVGGLTIPCAIEHTRPPTWRGVGIRASQEEVPAEFLLGKMVELV